VIAGVPAAADAGDAEAIAAAIEAARHARHACRCFAAEGSEALARRARSDPAALGALVAADAYAFAGVDGVDTGIGRWRFDPATGEALLSDDWIDDRAKFVAWWRFRERPAGAGRRRIVASWIARLARAARSSSAAPMRRRT
jgi:hypothetical protein